LIAGGAPRIRDSSYLTQADSVEQALTARDVFEVSPGSQGKWGLKVGPLIPPGAGGGGVCDQVLTVALDQGITEQSATAHLLGVFPPGARTDVAQLTMEAPPTPPTKFLFH